MWGVQDAGTLAGYPQYSNSPQINTIQSALGNIPPTVSEYLVDTTDVTNIDNDVAKCARSLTSPLCPAVCELLWACGCVSVCELLCVSVSVSVCVSVFVPGRVFICLCVHVASPQVQQG